SSRLDLRQVLHFLNRKGLGVGHLGGVLETVADAFVDVKNDDNVGASGQIAQLARDANVEITKGLVILLELADVVVHHGQVEQPADVETEELPGGVDVRVQHRGADEGVADELDDAKVIFRVSEGPKDDLGVARLVAAE